MHYMISYVVVGVKYELKTPVCLSEDLSRISFLRSVSVFLLRDFSPVFPVYLHTITLIFLLFTLIVVIFCIYATSIIDQS